MSAKKKQIGPKTTRKMSPAERKWRKEHVRLLEIEEKHLELLDELARKEYLAEKDALTIAEAK